MSLRLNLLLVESIKLRTPSRLALPYDGPGETQAIIMCLLEPTELKELATVPSQEEHASEDLEELPFGGHSTRTRKIRN